MIAISRLEDYRHDVYDVTCGSILGMSMAYFSYRRYYPSLRSIRCDEPYPSRATVALLNGVGKMRDEEQPVADTTNFVLDDMTDEPGETDPLHSGSRDSSASNSREPG
jgi:diacylglycerol diphosphate phosphatase / phosphatidate phosphatase